MTQLLVLTETGFYHKGSSLGGAESTPAQSPPLPQNQHCPCFTKGCKPKPCLEVPHIFICPLAGHTNRFSSFLECAFLCFRVTVLLQHLSFLGSGVHCFQPLCSKQFRKPCAMLHWITAFQRPKPGEAHIPAWDPVFRSGLSPMRGLSP